METRKQVGTLMGRPVYENAALKLAPGDIAFGASPARFRSFATYAEQTEEEREIAGRFTGQECRLNGKAARIIGRHRRLAIVYSTEQGVAEAQFPWTEIRDVMLRPDRPGEFESP